MPKNDHLLFAFFGVSLATRKRSRSTEVRFAVNNKNKILRVLGNGSNSDIYTPVLVRDFEDNMYPFKTEYKDFDEHPRWREQLATGFHPRGLMLKIRKFYAYYDKDKNMTLSKKLILLLDKVKENLTKKILTESALLETTGNISQEKINIS